jgi:pilus assembly protein CpaF
MIRLENMVGLAGVSIGLRAIRQQIVSALTAVIQISRLIDGSRKITSIQEITGMEGDVIEMQEIFQFHQSGVTADRRPVGSFIATGIRPKFAERLMVRGFHLPEAFFDPQRLAA